MKTKELIQELVFTVVKLPNLKLEIHRRKIKVSGFYKDSNGINSVIGISIFINSKYAGQQLQNAIEQVREL